MSNKNRTTVRTVRWALRRAALRAVHPFSPDGAAAMAAHWFLLPDLARDRRTPANGNQDGKRFEVKAGVVTLAAWEWGPANAPAVLLVHGWNGRGRQLAAVARAIARRGYRAVTFDQPGHGASGGTLVSIPRMAQAIAAVNGAIGGAEAVVAHSLGAVAATYALSRGLGARRAVFIAPPVSPARWFDTFSRIVGLPEESKPQLRKNVEARAGVAAADLDPLRLAPGLEAELVIVHDEPDREVPLAAGAALADAWPGARLVVTSGLGHNRLLTDRRTVATIAEAAAPEQVHAARPPGELRDPHLAEAVEAIAF
ncbi:MAG TPA: alpha/beta hydrolase [Kofleriaceae bacterium]|nr:alpha/beta hydrolase [Kofleriaceae bacterium]